MINSHQVDNQTMDNGGKWIELRKENYQIP